jgi:hypothetical protein
MQTLPQKDYHHIRAVSRVEILRQERRLSAMPSDTFHKILVADDGSPEGERAADVAVKLGAKFKAEVILLGVVGRRTSRQRAKVCHSKIPPSAVAPWRSVSSVF